MAAIKQSLAEMEGKKPHAKRQAVVSGKKSGGRA